MSVTLRHVFSDTIFFMVWKESSKASKAVPPILSSPVTSEVDVGDMAIELEPSH